MGKQQTSRAARHGVFSSSLVARMDHYHREKRALASKLHAARRARIAAFLRHNGRMATPVALRACTCGWARGPHATVCAAGLAREDDDADPLAATAADPVDALDRDLTLLEVVSHKE